MKEKGATAAYVIALLWNLSVWIGKNTEDIAYDMWQPNMSKHGRQCLQNTSMPVRHKELWVQTVHSKHLNVRTALWLTTS